MAKSWGMLLNALNLEQVVFVGHSLGAAIGVYFAANFQSRVSKLVLVDGGNDPADMNAALESIRVSLSTLDVSFPSMDDYINLFKQAPFLKEDWNEYVERYFAFDVETGADGSVRRKIPRKVIEAEIATYAGFQLHPLYSRIEPARPNLPPSCEPVNPCGMPTAYGSHTKYNLRIPRRYAADTLNLLTTLLSYDSLLPIYSDTTSKEHPPLGKSSS